MPPSGILFMCIDNGAPVPPALSPSSPIALVPPIAKHLEGSTIPKLSVILTPTAKRTANEEVSEESTFEEVFYYYYVFVILYLLFIMLC